MSDYAENASALPDAELLATKLLAQTGQTKPPVDLDSILSLWPSLHITTEALDGDGYLIDLGARGGEMVVRAGGNAARTRYTIAHELGHWMLRCERHDREKVEHRSACEDARPRSATIEKWCDQFAANLLIPGEWLQSDLNSRKVSALPDFLLRGPRTYAVSDQAFRLRVSQVTRISIYEISTIGPKTCISHRYDSPHVPHRQLLRALPLFSSMTPRPTPKPCLDSATNFVGIPIKYEESQTSGGHLLCVFPRIKHAS